MASFAFGKQLRLLTARHYQAVFDSAEWKASSKHFLLLARANQLEYPRLGLVIAKKNVRTAVQRNRIKRIIRDNFRLHQHELQGMDIVVLARRGADSLDNPTIHKALQKSWQQLTRRQQQSQGK